MPASRSSARGGDVHLRHRRTRGRPRAGAGRGGDRDVRVAGGADVLQQFLAAGLLDELELHVAPVFLGGGVRLFDRPELAGLRLERTRVIASPDVTHLGFRHTTLIAKENTMTDAPTTILVLGGTGKTGRRVAERLRARGRAVRVGSTSGEPPFDWSDRATWEPALAGVASCYVSYYPDLALPGAPAAVGAFARLAVARGVRRLVLLSGRGEEEAQRAELALQASGAEWTVVRCSWFNQNFSECFFQEPLAAGELALPADGVPEPFVDVEDIADVAVAALTEDGHAGRV